MKKLKICTNHKKIALQTLKKRKMTPNHDFLDNLANDQHQKMLREIANDDLTPKKRDSIEETEFFENETDPEPLYE